MCSKVLARTCSRVWLARRDWARFSARAFDGTQQGCGRPVLAKSLNSDFIQLLRFSRLRMSLSRYCSTARWRFCSFSCCPMYSLTSERSWWPAGELVEDGGDVEAEGGAKDGADLARLEVEDDVVEFLDHFAAGEDAEVATTAGAIGGLVGQFGEGFGAEFGGDLFDGGAGCLFGWCSRLCS